jgi:glucose-1-phosphate cytidylyltransferase
MKYYSSQGVYEFIICGGYKVHKIKEFFADYSLHVNNVTIDLSGSMPSVIIHETTAEPWKIHIIDTGYSSQTGERIRQIQRYVCGDSFFLTYGDGLSDVNLKELEQAHNRSGKMVTLTAVEPPGRYGALKLTNNDVVTSFQEKADSQDAWINGGFFVVSPSVFPFLQDRENLSWEFDILPLLASNNQLSAFKHRGFWQPMDTLRDKHKLESLWADSCAPWRAWQ